MNNQKFRMILFVLLGIVIALLSCIYVEMKEANRLQNIIIDYLYNVNHHH